MHYINIRGQPYEQVDGAAMGSPVSTVVVNMFTEFFYKDFSKFPSVKPALW